MTESSRIQLREYFPEEQELYHKWISDPIIMRFLDWKTQSVQESQQRFLEVLHQKHTAPRYEYYLAIVDKKSGLFLGNAGISFLEQSFATAEIGWIVLPEFQNRGYATEAGTILMEMAKSNPKCRKIIAECDCENKGSERVMQKLGMLKTLEKPVWFPNQKQWRAKLCYEISIQK